MTYDVYILYSTSVDKYYVGYTNNIERRLLEHNRLKGKYTDKGIPWRLVYNECFSERKLAEEREKEIKKKKSRIYIKSLIDSQVHHSR